MRRITFLSLITLTLALFTTTMSYGQNDKKEVAEEIVAVVGYETISLSELYETTQYVIEGRRQHGVRSKLQPAEEALEALLKQKLMTAYARLDSLDKSLDNLEKSVQEEVSRLIKENNGSIRDLEQKMGKSLLQIREDMKTQVADFQLAQMKEQEIREKITITYPEVVEFFSTVNVDSLAMQSPQISYAQIVKTPPATEERKMEVRQRLIEFRDRILNGEKIEVLARLYSMDGSKYHGGEYNNSYDQTIGPYSEAVRQMKPGQLSEIVETEFGFHIIKLISKTDDNFMSRHILLKPEFTVEEEEKVIQELDSLANVIRKGDITFAEAAARHSDDKETRMNGGKRFNNGGPISQSSTRFFLDQVDQMDGRTLSSMQIGDVSKPFQNMDSKGNMVYKIVTLTDKTPAHKVSLDQDYIYIETMALNTKQNKALKTWLDDAIKNIYVEIKPEYLDYNFENKAWKEQSEKYANK